VNPRDLEFARVVKLMRPVVLPSHAWHASAIFGESDAAAVNPDPPSTTGQVASEMSLGHSHRVAKRSEAVAWSNITCEGSRHRRHLLCL
jgi:hypothetical protein